MTTNRVEIDAPPHDVFAILMDADKYADWVVGAKRVRATDPNWPEVGSRFHHTVGPPLAELDDSSKLIERRDDERVVLEVRFRPIGVAVVAIDLEPTNRGRSTRVTMTERPKSGPVRSLWFRPLDLAVHFRNVLSLRRLARLVQRPA